MGSECCCSASLEEQEEAKRIVNIYYNGMKQPIAFYQGASRAAMERLTKQCYKLPLDLEVAFMDENGFPLVLDGQIPNGENIFMKRADTQNSSERKPFLADNVDTQVATTNTQKAVRVSQDDEEHEDSTYWSSSSTDCRMKTNKSPKAIVATNDEMNPKDITPRITREMLQWDENKNLRGIIDGKTWQTKGDWPFNCATVGGIDHAGGVYQYSIRFSGERDDFMYVYHQFGMIFKDEMGALGWGRVWLSVMPMFRFDSSMSRTEGVFEIIVDVRTKEQVKYDRHEQGVYFILKPENRCLAFSSLYGKQPTKEAVLLFAISTKNQCKCVLQDVRIVDFGKHKIVKDHLIETVADKKNKLQEVWIRKI